MKQNLDVNQFLAKTSEILAKTLCVEKIEVPITLDTRIINGVGANDLELSSIDYVDFLMQIEEEYDIVYGFETIIYTVGDIYNYVREYTSENEEG